MDARAGAPIPLDFDIRRNKDEARCHPMSDPKIIAFHLPQFHEIEENNRWWGQGFTEWTNVRRATPLYRGHRQPRIPAGDRYYDMMQRDTREWQADLARRHGVHGFCYYHYWFNGKQLLERPVEALLEDGGPDFPFCLAWANEPWTRAWDGGERDVLMPQSYGDEADWDLHFASLLRSFRDPRYIRVDGRPMLLVYRCESIPTFEPMLARWRALAAEAGLPGLHVVAMQTAYVTGAQSRLADARAQFEPMYTLKHDQPRWYRLRQRISRQVTKLGHWLAPDARSHRIDSHDYGRLWQLIRRRPLSAGTYPGAFADWDNSPRRGANGLVLRNFSLRTFRRGLATQLKKARTSGAPFVFFNAWNEWAEGTYLEPDTHRGTSLLDIVAELTRAPHRNTP